MKIFSFLFFSLLIVFILLILFFFLIFNGLLENSDKSSSFECGFASISSLGVVFSMPFFAISIMFLLFDVEILVLCFYPIFSLSDYYLVMFVYFIIFIILFSTLFEWIKGILSWF